MIPSRLSGKAEKAYRIVDAVKLNNNIFGVRVIVKKEADKYKVEGGEYTQFRAYDVTTKKNQYQAVYPETTPKMEKWTGQHFILILL